MGSMWTDSQSGLTSDSSGQSYNISNANNSLLRALESEQEAHEITRSQLENESTARREAEADTQRLVEHNKSLLNSIKLLQSTVKHMVQQQENKNSDERTSEEVENDIKEFKKQAERKQVANSILYDVLANYKVPHTTVNNGEESTSFINLDLLNTPDPDDFSEKAQLQRTLRRQIGLSAESESADENAPNEEYRQKMNAIVKAENSADVVLSEDLVDIKEPKSQQTKSNGIASIVQAPLNQTQAPGAIESLFPDLPSTFLAKYGNRSSGSSEKHEDLVHITTPKKSTLTATLPIRSREVSNEKEPACTIVGLPDTIALNWRVDGRHADELRGVRAQTKTDNYFREHPIRFGR